jgi:glycine/D-amino acid oxidase-like deaminating enzyme
MIEPQDAVVIGGGFYGANIALYLAQQRGFKRIVLIEREGELLTRASYNNQARVHNGYHYPRCFTTAYRSRVNLPRFTQLWPQAVKRDFTKLYAIARRNSKVTAQQFKRFCADIGADIAPATAEHRKLFERRLVEEVFEVQEFAFDATRLRSWASQELIDSGVRTLFNTRASAISRMADGDLLTTIESASGEKHFIKSAYVFNCTYSGLNQFRGDYAGLDTQLRHEITEMALVQVPDQLQGIGVTVMDGPFFSVMPFPARALHTLSHVRYTPHMSWTDEPGINPYDKLASYARTSRFERMARDVSRYMPPMRDVRHVESLFEIKTVLVKNDDDDGRPILVEHHVDLGNCYSILGGKIDNIYDVLERLDQELLITTSPSQQPTLHGVFNE